nr:hypothetical protein [Nocardioides sp.]
MRTEPVDAGSFGASAQGAVERVGGESAPAFAEPELGPVGVALCLSVREVAADRGVRGGADGDDTTAAALPVPDGDEAGVQVEVAGGEGDDLVEPDSNLRPLIQRFGARSRPVCGLSDSF